MPGAGLPASANQTLNTTSTPTFSSVRVGTVLDTNGAQVVGTRGATVTSVSGGATQDLEARAAINALLAICRTHGLIAT